MKSFTLYALAVGFAAVVLSPRGFGQEANEVALREPHGAAFYIWTPVVPTAVLTAGTALSFVPELHVYEVSLRDNLQQSTGGKRCHIDNVTQYLPSVSVLGLNLCGVKSRSSLKRQTLMLAESYLIGGAVELSAKHFIDKLRPDGRSYNSFPSGHTFTAFVGAEMLRLEYGEEYPAIAVAGYAVAMFTGVMRMYNNRHWAGDVLAGAAIGILSVQLTDFINAPHRTH